MGAKDVAVHAQYEQKNGFKNLHAKKSIFGINVKISKINAKWNTNIEKMEYNFGTQLDHGEDEE